MYWPVLNMYSENFGFGPRSFLLGVPFKIGGRDDFPRLMSGRMACRNMIADGLNKA